MHNKFATKYMYRQGIPGDVEKCSPVEDTCENRLTNNIARGTATFKRLCVVELDSKSDAKIKYRQISHIHTQA